MSINEAARDESKVCSGVQQESAKESWRWHSRLIVVVILGCACGSGPTAVAASPEALLLPPEYTTQDRNNVDIAALKASFDITDVSIGMSGRPLASTVRIDNPGVQTRMTFSYMGTIGGSGNSAADWQALANYYGCSVSGGVAVQIGSSSDPFCLANSSYVAVRNPAASLVKNTDGSYLYTSGDGTKYTFQEIAVAGNIQLISTVRPDGLTTLNYYNQSTGVIQSVVRNDGLQLRIMYTGNTFSGAMAINSTIDYCDPLAVSCTTSIPWPQSSYGFTYPDSSTNQIVITDQGSLTTRITSTGGSTGLPRYISGYKPSTSATQDTVSYTYCDTPQSGHWLCVAINDGSSWGYVLGPSCDPYGNCHVAMTSGDGTQSTIIHNQSSSSFGVLAPLVDSTVSEGATDESVFRSYDLTSPTNRLSTVTYAVGDFITYYYDSRGNVTSAVHTPQPGSPLATISATANYDVVCVYPVKCNKPNWVKDAYGNQTDYTYDTVHGGVLTVTQPAVPVRIGGTVTQVRPQTRYGYVQRYAWYKNSAGTVVQAPSPIWVLSTEKFCRTTAVNSNGVGCTTATDEVVTTYDYGPTSGANNLFLRGKAVTADGVTLRTCYAYDTFGNRISETSPNAGLTSCP